MRTRSVDDKLADLRQHRDDIALLERAIIRRYELVAELVVDDGAPEAAVVEASGLSRAIIYRKAADYRDHGGGAAGRAAVRPIRVLPGNPAGRNPGRRA
jgi:hypothetical protein